MTSRRWRRSFDVCSSARVCSSPSCTPAPEALESWTLDGRFDVVVADVTMPGMGGIEVVEALRRDDPEVRVVLASGYASDRVAHLIDDRTQFLRKPFSRRELVETVAGVMRWPVAS
ncbi:MAG: response regulator [Myxococcota bacterium]